LRRFCDSIGSHLAVECGSASFLAQVSFFRLRSEAAWALLRPSASASAKLANNTVNHSQSAMARMKAGDASPLPVRAWTNSRLVMMLPM